MWTQPPTLRTFSVKGDGFDGTYVRPAGVQQGPAAVLVLGGSEDGEPTFSAEVLAAEASRPSRSRAPRVPAHRLS